MALSSPPGRLAAGLRSFVAVGAVGFVIDAGLLAVLTHGAGWSPWLARVPSFLTAVTATWQLNRRLTFAGRGLQSRSLEALGYGAVQVSGALINLAVFGSCLGLFPQLAALPLIPFAVGAVVAMIFNYLTASRLLYAREREAGSNE
jgi:putative flippase GtrA